MANAFAQITGLATYKGHTIEKVESPLQIVYVVDGDRERACWSMADAKRLITGKELTYEPVNINNWFN